MITGMIVAVLLIAMLASAGEGEWGSVAVGAVIIVVLLMLFVFGRESDRAYINFVDYWANRHRSTDRKRGVIVKPEPYAADTAVPYTGNKHPQEAFVCHCCGRFVRAKGTKVWTASGMIRVFTCPACGGEHITKI